ncbi:hypothetical protein [Streptomyces ossamyceticus]|uniref:Uncharacterized protein n=1 Tax=Streptomyces ossamyceticus TaxID=249581 RepID=A0ABV2V711_9ACTN
MFAVTDRATYDGVPDHDVVTGTTTEPEATPAPAGGLATDLGYRPPAAS